MSSLQHASSTLSTFLALPSEVALSTVLPTTPLQIISTGIVPSTFSAVLTATATATSIANSTDESPGAENGECRLLGPASLFIQATLGALALLSLVYKRWRERPQRPVKIWAFDASKQVVGSVLLHIANLFMSMLSSGELEVKAGDYQANPCSFYLLNLAIDTTIGIPILIVLLRVLHAAFALTPLAQPPESIQSGNYGHPPKATWWAKQCIIYFQGLLGMKLCVFLLFQLCPWIIHVGDWALRWTEGNKTVQILFVMLIFPVIMNALQYYIIDGFIKDQRPGDHEPIPSDDGEETDDEGARRTGRRRSAESEQRSEGAYDSDEEATAKNLKSVEAPEVSDKGVTSTGSVKSRSDLKELKEYDPAIDGERGTSSGSSVKGVRSAASPPNERAEEAKKT